MMMTPPQFMLEERQPTLPELISFLRQYERQMDSYVWPVVRRSCAHSYGYAGVCLVMVLLQVPSMLDNGPDVWINWLSAAVNLACGFVIWWRAEGRFNSFMASRVALHQCIVVAQSAYSSPSVNWKAPTT